MSVRPANTPHTNRRAARWVALVAFCGVACGLTAALGRAQPPKPPTKQEDLNKKVANLDPNAPVTADGPRRSAPERFSLDTKAPIFHQVEDGPGVQPEDKNANEYQSWCFLVLHAKKFATAELEQHAARDLIAVDLHMSKPQRSLFRYELLRFDGKTVCARRLAAPKYFADNPDFGVPAEMYEVRFVPVDDSPLTPVSIVFLELPDALAAVKEKKVGEWLDVPDRWISAAGFYFKTMSVPSENGGTPVSIPLLVGKGVTPLSGPPVAYGNDPTALDRDTRVFKFIKDRAPMVRGAVSDTNWAEVASLHRVLMHSARFSAEQLEEHALPGVKFADLFEDIRRDYKLKNVKFEGRLISLRKWPVTPELQAAGVEPVFEGWIIPINEPRGNPICALFTEPVPGVELTKDGRVNKWVTFAGFSFKLMMYESQEDDPKTPGKKLNKYAPLLVGRGPILRPDPDRDTPLTWGAFVKWAIIGGLVIVVGGGAITWYFRRGDRTARAEIDAVRGRNPFDAAAQKPPELTEPNVS